MNWKGGKSLSAISTAEGRWKQRSRRLVQALADLTQITEMLEGSLNYFTLDFRAASGKRRNKFPSVCKLIEGFIANLASLITIIFPRVIWLFYGGHYYRFIAYVEKKLEN